MCTRSRSPVAYNTVRAHVESKIRMRVDIDMRAVFVPAEHCITLALKVACAAGSGLSKDRLSGATRYFVDSAFSVQKH